MRRVLCVKGDTGGGGLRRASAACVGGRTPDLRSSCGPNSGRTGDQVLNRDVSSSPAWRHAFARPAIALLACLPLLTGCSDSGGGPTQSEAAARDGIVLTIDEGQDVDAARVEDTVAVLRRRIDALGVDAADVQSDTQRIVVTFPPEEGVDLDMVAAVLTRRAALEFRKVLEVFYPDSKQFQQHVKSCDGSAATPADQLDQEVVRCEAGPPSSSEPGDPATASIYRLGPALLTNADVDGAEAFDDETGSHVELDFNAEGAKAFERVTGELACEDAASPTRQMAIVIDDVVVSAPGIAEEVPCGRGISGGNALISAEGGMGEAESLAVALRAGALPLALTASGISASEK